MGKLSHRTVQVKCWVIIWPVRRPEDFTLPPLMAKRRPDDPLLHDSPSKKHCRAFCKLDMRVGGIAPVAGGNPPSLLALLGGRDRKRPRYFEDLDKEQSDEEPLASLCRRDTRKHAAGSLSDQTSGNLCKRRSSSNSKKRTRDSDSETARGDKEKVSNLAS